MPVWERSMVSTSRGVFEVFTSGEGRPLCVTHYYSAFTEKGNYFADIFTGKYKVHLVNLKEAGKSDRVNDESELGMEETVLDLEALRKSLYYDTWSFAGHSTGGMLGLVYGMTHGGSLDSLIVVGAAASNEYMNSSASIYCKKHPSNARLMEIFRIMRQAASREETMVAAREWTAMSLHHPERWEQYFANPSSGSTVQSRLNFYNKQLAGYDIREGLNRIRVPTLVICGEHDAQCPAVFSEEIHRLVEGSELHILTDSNHSPHLEEPERFEEIIGGFHDKCFGAKEAM